MATTPSRGPMLLRAAALVIVLAALAAAPYWTGRSELRLLGEFFSLLALASLWNLLAGYAGLVSVGQQAFVGIGGYTLFVATVFLGLGPLVAIPLAAVVGGVLGGIFAPLLFRLEGAYFAIGTWVAAEVVSIGFGMIPQLGGGAGMSLPTAVVSGMADGRSAREALIYWLLMAMGCGTVLGIFALLRSKAGLALMAIRDNALAAGSLGINIWRTRFLVYTGVAAATGAVGAVIFLQKLRISPESAFSVNDWTGVVIFMVVIGGIGTIEGAIVGTIVYFVLREFLADQGTIYLVVLGVLAIATMMLARRGIWGAVAERLEWPVFPVERRP